MITPINFELAKLLNEKGLPGLIGFYENKKHYSWEDDEGKTRNNFKCLSVDIERNRCYIDEELELDPPHCVVQYVGENKLDATFICVSDFAKIFNERKK